MNFMKKTLLCFTVVSLLISISFAGAKEPSYERLPVDMDYSYDYTDWYTDEMVSDLEKGEYGTFLSQFDFVHDTIPTGQNKDWSWNGFYLGNGQVGMIVDYLGSQATPYHLLDYTSVWRSSLDSLCTVTRSPEIKSEYWDVYNNTAPSIGLNEAWSKEKQPSGQGNWYERGALGLRFAAFPIIDGEFDPAKITDYNQRVALAEYQCHTEFIYDDRVAVKITSFASWKSNRMIAYKAEIKNITDENVSVGFVADPIVAFRNKRIDFSADRKILTGNIAKSEDGLFYDHWFALAAEKNDRQLNPADGRFKDEISLKPGADVDYSAYMSFYCGTSENISIESPKSDINDAVKKNFAEVSAEHIAEVHDFWDDFYVLLPWKDLCKTYYRNVLICAGNMRGGMYNAQVCMMTNSAYRGLSYGMDNMPAIELMLQLGRTDYLKNFAETLRASMPEDKDNSGHTINYDYDQFPWRTAILCNAPGNTMWMLYEYYLLTGDEEYLKNTLYPMMRAISNFYYGYAEEINGVYGFWTRKNYQDKTWMILSYDEKLFTGSKTPYSWGEIDHPTDLVGPAKLTLKLTIDIANRLGVDADLVKNWQYCHDRLQIPQNENFYQHYIARPDGMGLGEDVFPFRHIMACAVYNLTYPTPVVTNDRKMEDTYRIIRDTSKCHFEWFFNYNQQLWGAVARMRLGDELEWLMTESDMKLDKTFHKDGMMICEHQLGGMAGYFFMPYGMIAASVNEMLLQSYDGILKVFPAVFPGFKEHPVSFKGLHGLGGFTVSAASDKGMIRKIEIISDLGNDCSVEIPTEWGGFSIADASGNSIGYTSAWKQVRDKGKDVTVKVITFATKKGETYILTASCDGQDENICQNGKTVSETVGITHAGISYTHDETVSCMKDGAQRILDLGSKVIKLWFSDDPQGVYPVNCDWALLEINNSLDLIRTDYYKEVLDMDFKTIVLETHTFDKTFPESNINWLDGMTAEESVRLEKEMYELSKYLYLTYDGTGKEFILQNWEGDNMLGGRFWRQDPETGMYYMVEKGISSVNKEDDARMRTMISGLTEWFNARQRGVDRAREEFGKNSDVSVRHALELNFAYLDRDEGWPYKDSPMLLEDVVPYTDCDLYSLSCWGSLTVETAHTLRDRLVLIQDAVEDTYIDLADGGKEKPRRPFVRPGQVSRLMLGEYGAIERLQGSETGSWTQELNEMTDLRHREVLQIQTELALDLGLEYVLYWELYCNVPRTDTNPPITIDNRNGERAESNDMLQGNWLIRVDGSVTEGYKYLHGLFKPSESLYSDKEVKYGNTYFIDGDFEGFEVSGTLVSDTMLTNMSDGKTFGQEIMVSGSADGKDFRPVETEAYFIQCIETEGIYTADIRVVNKSVQDKGLRYFRIEGSDASGKFTPDRVKFYRPKKTIKTIR